MGLIWEYITADGDIGNQIQAHIYLPISVTSGDIVLNTANSYGANRGMYCRWSDGNNNKKAGFVFDYNNHSGANRNDFGQIYVRI